jgi:hypothetical protein
VYNEGIGGQYSTFNYSRGRSYLPKHVENALAPQVFIANAGLQLKSGIGLQNVTVALELNAPAIANLATSSDKISRVLYKRATGDVTFTNIFLSNAYVIIYDVIARKDIALNLIGDPATAWAQSDTDTSASLAYKALGSTPWQSELFNEFYKVAQVTNVVLAAGATHVHKIRLNPNRIVSDAYATYCPFALKDVTYWTVVEIHGSPANDTTTQTQVSVGVGGVNMVIDAEHTLKILQKQTPVISVSSGLPITFTVGEQVLNMGGSTIVPQAEG